MIDEPRVKLPGQPTQKQELLPIGTLVKLKNAPHGEEGVSKARCAAAPAPRKNPYTRLLRKLDADSARKPQLLTTMESHP
jgi:hypothetical protein